jgi:5-methylthioadenosine/S-adenosylhomocysteine deaminase
VTPRVDTRITGALVVTMDAAGRELAGACVEITNGRFTHVGLSASDGPAAETVEAWGQILLPGLVNSHLHSAQLLGRGLADDVDLLTWLRDRIWPYESALTPEDAHVSALALCAEQIRNGVTLFADPGGHHVDHVARAVDQAGIRAYLGRNTVDGGEGLPEGWLESTQEALARADELAERWHGAAGGRLRFNYTLRTIFNCSDELILGSAERAERLGTILHTHIAEIPEENDYALATRGATTARHLHTLGVLGPRFLGAHGVYLDDHELDLIAAGGASISHNAGSNLKVLGIPRVADMLERGVRVALGTDSAPANNRMSLVDEMWAASLLQKGLRRDPTVLPARTVLRMATRDGAGALAWDDELGSIETGKAADLVLVDPRTVNMLPLHDPVAALVTAMKTENIRSTMCAGRWLMRDRVVLSLDEEALLDEVRERAAAIAARAAIRWGEGPGRDMFDI